MPSISLRAPTLSLLICALTSLGNAQINAITNQPYTVTVKTSHVLRLADGTNINTESTAINARDSQGRTLQQQDTGAGMRGGAQDVIMSSVFNPADHTMTHWSSLGSTAYVLHMPTPQNLANAQRQSAAMPASPTTNGSSASSVVLAVGGGIGAAPSLPAGSPPTAYVPSRINPNLHTETRRENLGSKTSVASTPKASG